MPETIGFDHPFDFGSMAAARRHAMPKHGRQDGGPLVKVMVTEDQPAVVKRYCGQCVLEPLYQFCHGEG